MRHIVIGLCLWLVACQPAATPFPVDMPTPSTVTPAPGTSPLIRYGFAANTIGALPDREALYPEAAITQLTDPINLNDLGTRFDIMVTLGAYPDAIPSPTLLNYMLLINSTLPPLADPDLLSIISRSLNPDDIIQSLDVPGIRVTPRATTGLNNLRTELANAGWPDGFSLRLAHDTALGFEVLHSHFQALNIDLVSVPLNSDFQQTNLLLVTWSSLRERNQWTSLIADENQAIELFGLPISYWAVPEVTVTFTPQGWPVASR